MSDYNAESGLDGLRFNWLGNLQITNTHHAPMPFRLPSVESENTMPAVHVAYKVCSKVYNLVYFVYTCCSCFTP